MTSNTPTSLNEISPHSYIVADIHLQSDPKQPINQHFLSFLNNHASHADALYILGDLFEMWVGDDICLELYKPIIDALKTLSENGTKLYIQYGNRDFLMRKAFCNSTNARVLNDIEHVNFYGSQYLLLHGDTLCTDDVGYQRMRKVVRNKLVQFIFLALSKKRRLAIGNKMRQSSREYSAEKETQIMDVNSDAVKALFQEYPEVNDMIHGHTHRPAVHKLQLDGMQKRRWVLGDWRPEAKILKLSGSGAEMIDY